LEPSDNAACTRLWCREYVKYTTIPIASQMISRAQFTQPSLYIMYPLKADAENRHQGHPRRAERPRLIGIRVPQHHYRYAHNHECQQRADIHHLPDVINRRQAAYNAARNPTRMVFFQGVRKRG
jgi:hypothetical protein